MWRAGLLELLGGDSTNEAASPAAPLSSPKPVLRPVVASPSGAAHSPSAIRKTSSAGDDVVSVASFSTASLLGGTLPMLRDAATSGHSSPGGSASVLSAVAVALQRASPGGWRATGRSGGPGDVPLGVDPRPPVLSALGFGSSGGINLRLFARRDAAPPRQLPADQLAPLRPLKRHRRSSAARAGDRGGPPVDRLTEASGENSTSTCEQSNAPDDSTFSPAVVRVEDGKVATAAPCSGGADAREIERTIDNPVALSVVVLPASTVAMPVSTGAAVVVSPVVQSTAATATARLPPSLVREAAGASRGEEKPGRKRKRSEHGRSTAAPSETPSVKREPSDAVVEVQSPIPAALPLPVAVDTSLVEASPVVRKSHGEVANAAVGCVTDHLHGNGACAGSTSPPAERPQAEGLVAPLGSLPRDVQTNCLEPGSKKRRRHKRKKQSATDVAALGGCKSGATVAPPAHAAALSLPAIIVAPAIAAEVVVTTAADAPSSGSAPVVGGLPPASMPREMNRKARRAAAKLLAATRAGAVCPPTSLLTSSILAAPTN